MDNKQIKLAGTFSLNKHQAIHRWYPYMEGYSAQLIEHELDNLNIENIQTIYDPFGGSGTTLLVATQKGIKPCYSEINPFMSMVCQTKINGVRQIAKDSSLMDELLGLKNFLEGHSLSKNNEDVEFDGFEKFFEPYVLRNIIELLDIINKKCINNITNQVARIGVACIAVEISKMIRRGDLRYAKDKEKDCTNINVKEVYMNKLAQIIEDINLAGDSLVNDVELLAEDSRDIQVENRIDCVITSPPYLNGTNYIRNTKLELKIMGFIDTEKDLPTLHSKTIIAGINNVSKRNSNIEVLKEVKPYIEELEPVAYDKRIPVMVAGYFYDMNNMLGKLKKAMKNEAIFIMDIGDSQFAGVHIPTHEILKELAYKHGFIMYDETILRTRRSKNGMALSQRVMRFKLIKGENNE